MKKILWINPKWPFPADDGAKQATVQLVRELAVIGAAANCEFHFLSLTTAQPSTIEYDAAIRELKTSSLTPFLRCPSTPREHLKNLVLTPRFPLTLAPYASKKVRQKILRQIQEIQPDLVVFDGLHAGAGWPKIVETLRAGGKRVPPTVYRAHNVEADLWYRKANQETNAIKKILLNIQGKKVERFELELIGTSAGTLCVSPDDVTRFIELRPSLKPTLHTVPIGLSTDGADLNQRPKALNYLFVGKLDWAPNQEGLNWLLREVWPSAIKINPDIQLTIVGSGKSEWLKNLLASHPVYSAVAFKGRVESVAPYYNASVASLVPIFFGSGTRVKAIESSLFGRTCISTALGVEGLGLRPSQEFLQAESKEEWIAALAKTAPQSLEEIGRAAHASIAPRFSPKLVAERCFELLKSIESSNVRT